MSKMMHSAHYGRIIDSVANLEIVNEVLLDQMLTLASGFYSLAALLGSF